MTIGLGTRLVHKRNRELTTRRISSIVVGKVYEHHTDVFSCQLIATGCSVAG